jgi:hypothetical protein
MLTFHDMRTDDNMYGYGFRVVKGKKPSHAALSVLEPPVGSDGDTLGTAANAIRNSRATYTLPAFRLWASLVLAIEHDPNFVGQVNAFRKGT